MQDLRTYISEAVSHGRHNSPVFDKEPKELKTLKDLEEFLAQFGYIRHDKYMGYMPTDKENAYCLYKNISKEPVVKIHPGGSKYQYFIHLTTEEDIKKWATKETIVNRNDDYYIYYDALEEIIKQSVVTESYIDDRKNYLFKCLDKTSDYSFDVTLETCPELEDYYSLSRVSIGRELRAHPEYVCVFLVEVNEDEQYMGNGTDFMSDLCEWADKNSKTITLTPSDDFGATSVGRLIKFYKRFGFVENKGKHTDFTTKQNMYRKPR